jgi:putative FmdB family regulatory protein
MPIYEYECEQCGVRFEKTQRFADPILTDCPECNGHIHRVMQPVGVIFKGSGFYVTDNKGRSSTAIPKKKDEDGKPASESSSTPTTSTPPTATTTAASKESKDG